MTGSVAAGRAMYDTAHTRPDKTTTTAPKRGTGSIAAGRALHDAGKWAADTVETGDIGTDV